MSEGAAEIYLEFVKLGAFVKVSAIDVQSGAEASIVAPAGTTTQELERLARQKLAYIKNKKPSRSVTPRNGVIV